MGHKRTHAFYFATSLLFLTAMPIAAIAQDNCRTPADEAEMKRLQAELDSLIAQEAQIEIDMRAHQARYDTLTAGTTGKKLLDEAWDAIVNDDQRFNANQKQQAKDRTALYKLDQKPCPAPTEKKSSSPSPPLAPAPTPGKIKPPPCRTPLAEAELKDLRTQRDHLQIELSWLKGPIKRAARAIIHAKEMAKSDPLVGPTALKAAEAEFERLEKKKQETERDLTGAKTRIDALEALSPCPQPAPAQPVVPPAAKPPDPPVKPGTAPDQPYEPPPLEPPVLPPADVVPPQKKEPDSPPAKKTDKGPLGLGIQFDLGIGLGHKHDDDRHRRDRDRDDDKSHQQTEKPPEDR